MLLDVVGAPRSVVSTVPSHSMVVSSLKRLLFHAMYWATTFRMIIKIDLDGLITLATGSIKLF